MFRDQLRFRFQPMLDIVAGLRSRIHIIAVSLFGHFVRCGGEIFHGCRSGGSGIVLILAVMFVFHPVILGDVVVEAMGCNPTAFPLLLSG